MSAAEKFSPAEVRRGLKCLLYDGGLFSTMSSLCGGLFVTAYALVLGASDFWIGILAALPMLADAAQPVGAWVLERFGDRRRFSLIMFACGRSLWVIVVLLPFLGYHGGKSETILYVLLSVTTLSAVLGAFGMVSQISLMADIVPADRRGRYFGARATIGTAASSLVALGGGRFLDWWKNIHGPNDPHGFTIVYALGLVAGLLSVAMIARLPQPEASTDKPAPYREVLQAMLKHRHFCNLIAYRTLLAFSVAFAGPFFAVYMLKILHMSYALVSTYQVVTSLCMVMAMRPWGRLSDHFGNRPVIIGTTFGAAIIPLIWLLTASGNRWVILVVFVVSGISWAGLMLSTFNLLLKITPDEQRSIYIGIFNATVGLSWAAGAAAGGWVSQSLEHFRWQIGGAVFINFHVLMLFSGLGRLASIVLIRRVAEPQAARVTRMMRVLWRTRAVNPLRAAQYYWYVLQNWRSDRGP